MKSVFSHLSLCAKEGKRGYSCLAGEVLRKRTGQVRAIFLQTALVGLSPQHPAAITFRDPLPARYRRRGQRRIIDQSEKLFQKGLDTLENFTQLKQQQSSIKPRAMVTQKC